MYHETNSLSRGVDLTNLCPDAHVKVIERPIYSTGIISKPTSKDISEIFESD